MNEIFIHEHIIECKQFILTAHIHNTFYMVHTVQAKHETCWAAAYVKTIFHVSTFLVIFSYVVPPLTLHVSVSL